MTNAAADKQTPNVMEAHPMTTGRDTMPMSETNPTERRPAWSDLQKKKKKATAAELDMTMIQLIQVSLYDIS